MIIEHIFQDSDLHTHNSMFEVRVCEKVGGPQAFSLLDLEDASKEVEVLRSPLARLARVFGKR